VTDEAVKKCVLRRLKEEDWFASSKQYAKDMEKFGSPDVYVDTFCSSMFLRARIFFLRSSLRIFSSLVNSEEQIREIERLKDFHLEEKAYWARRKAGDHEGMNIADCGCDCMGCHYERCVDCSACKNICMDCRVPTGLILRRRTQPSSSWKSQTHFRCNEKETQGISLIRKESTLLRRRQSPVKDNSPLESRHRVSLS